MDSAFAILREEAQFAELMRKRLAVRPSSELSPAEKEIPPPPARQVVVKPPKKRKFGVEIFFAFSFLLALMGIIYGNRDGLATAFPQFSAPLSAYASFVDVIKSGLIIP